MSLTDDIVPARQTIALKAADVFSLISALAEFVGAANRRSDMTGYRFVATIEFDGASAAVELDVRCDADPTFISSIAAFDVEGDSDAATVLAIARILHELRSAYARATLIIGGHRAVMASEHGT